MRFLLILSLLLVGRAMADEPKLVIETRLSPNTQVLVGGVIKLEVDLMVDTWFSKPAQLPKLELPGATVSEPSSDPTHLNQTIDGTPFFGIRYSYRISPQRAQRFDIPALSIEVLPGQGSSAQTVQSEAVSFTATQPAGVAQGAHALVAQKLTLTQRIVRSREPLQTGDSITRQLSIRAEGGEAMLIPAPQFSEVAGLKLYLNAPRVSALSSGRGDVSGGQRDDAATYTATEGGDYTLPAIKLKWWDQTGQEQVASVPAVTFEVAAGSAYQQPFSVSEDLRRLGRQTKVHITQHWLFFSLLVLMFGLLGYFGRPYLQRALTALKQRRTRRQQVWLESPDYAWRELKAQLENDSPRLDALYRWIRLTTGHDELNSLNEQLPAPLANELDAWIKARYSASSHTPADNKKLLEILQQVRNVLKQQSPDTAPAGGLLPLNPTG
ncbi:BatD family protein [Pseudomonas sp. MS19]|uniref:BatD family protein n=1 Tax=Pseudomonas sp. MS19 TaxID=2579939 RepID=UPI0015623E62|nr:BatD family protein [Pseudomonas sp. MS19]NRH28364.1 protein BatD [Pseudomonas sp. MS19]